MKKGICFVVVLLIGYFTFTVITARFETPVLVESAMSKYVSLKYSDLSKEHLDILLKIQDPNFFTHGGTDFSNRIVTTITQSLVKKLYFEKFEPGLAKIKQSLIARFALDPKISKENQITLFINMVYMGTYKGEQVIGYQSASKKYFGKDFSDLSEDEFLMLTAMLAAPDRFHVLEKVEENKERVLRLKYLLKGNCRREGLFKAYLLENCKS